MKKTIIAAALVAILFSSNARAQSVTPAAVMLGGETSSTLFAGAAGFGILVTYLIAEQVDPWSPLFEKVEYSYPHQRNKI